jgi:phosphoribosylformylglycinamidine cyclo-ligase
VVDRAQILDGSGIEAGDALVALPSSGLHTNGFTLARSVLADLDWQIEHPSLGQSIGEALLAVHRCYLREVQAMQQAGVEMRGLAHITGGGLIENLPRILPEGLGAVVQAGTWPVPPIFKLIQRLGAVEDREMFRVFNMGLGMLAVLPEAQVPLAQSAADCYPVGRIVAEASGVRVEGL